MINRAKKKRCTCMVGCNGLVRREPVHHYPFSCAMDCNIVIIINLVKKKKKKKKKKKFTPTNNTTKTGFKLCIVFFLLCVRVCVRGWVGGGWGGARTRARDTLLCLYVIF